MINCRKETVKLLCKTFSEESYSNILLDSVLSSAEMTLQDRKFMTTLYYGVLEKKITLDYIISLYSTRKPSKLDKTVLNILRTGIYQIKYMDSVPDNAAVNEAVKLARGFRVSSASGFINAVLRNFIRGGAEYSEPSDEKMKLSVRYSVEPDIIKLVSDGYGREFAEAFFERSLEKSPVYVRFNRNAADEEEFFRALGKTEAVRLDILPDCYALSSGNLTGTEAFRKGYFHVQDISSQFACAALNPKENDTVLDLCSAPGGKTFTMAQMMKGTGRVIAFDLHAHRAELIREGAERLGLKNVTALQGDALVHNPGLEGADKILCDVPCSGLGVIRKKLEIRYKKTDNFSELYDIQFRILQNAASYLKKGGELVYSTCTLNRRENDDIIDRFLAENSEFEGVNFLEETGEPFGSYKAVLGASGPDCDGFFISKIRRK